MSGEPSGEPSYTGKELEVRRKEKDKARNSLKLVHSSPTGKDKNQPRKEVEREETSDSGFPMMSDAEYCGLGPVHKEKVGAHPKEAKKRSGDEVYKLWRGAVLAEHPARCISESPTKKLVEQAAAFYKLFNEFFPTDSVADFFTYLTKNWEAACKNFKDEGIWQKLGSYPEIPTLLPHSDHVLTWYKKKKGNSNGSVLAKKPSSPVYMKGKADKVPEVIPLAPLKGCVRTTEKGRTFCERP